MALGLMSFSVLSPAGAQPQDLSNLSEVPTLAVFDETNSNGVVTPTWTTPGMTTQHPSTGGTWEYGFLNAKVRSYYTVNRCHGSTVKDGAGRESRSANTASGYKSIAEIWAINSPNLNPVYHYRVC